MSDFFCKNCNRIGRFRGKIRGASVVFLYAVFILFSLSGCGGDVRDCGDMMNEFADHIGFRGQVLYLSAEEFEDGYIRDGLFEELFGGGEELIEDFAYFSASTTSHIAECCVILCRSEYDALSVIKLCSERAALADKLSEDDLSSDTVIIKSGRYIVFGVMPDKEDTIAFWKGIL